MKNKKILILNWMDIKNPLAGGAEVYTHEIAKRLVNLGHDVTLFTSHSKNLLPRENIDGVEIIRKGNRCTIYLHAFFYIKSQKHIDLIVEEINTYPFFTKLYANKPIVLLIYQLCKESWFKKEMPMLLLSPLGYLLEPIYLRFYKNIKTVTISESTKKDLSKLGFSNVEIVEIAFSHKCVSSVFKKEGEPTLIYVGGFRKQKRIDDVITAFKIINNEIPESKLWIVGSGSKKVEKRVLGLINRYKLNSKIKLFGYVNKNKKLNLMKRAHILLVTSIREGWGLIVTEANSMGTISVAYNVPGLRDSIIDNQTGILTEYQKPSAIAKEVLKLFKNKTKLDKLSKNALKHSNKFSWDDSAKKFNLIIKRILKNEKPKL